MTIAFSLNLWHALLLIQVLGMAWALYRLRGVTELLDRQFWRGWDALFTAFMLVVVMILVVIWPLGILASYIRGPA